jgi:hypothetical protein
MIFHVALSAFFFFLALKCLFIFESITWGADSQTLFRFCNEPFLLTHHKKKIITKKLKLWKLPKIKVSILQIVYRVPPLNFTNVFFFWHSNDHKYVINLKYEKKFK